MHQAAIIRLGHRMTVNTRKALMGLGLLRGKTLKEAGLEAGYAPSTVRAAARNGLSAEQCLAEAQKLDPRADPAKLVATAQACMEAALEALNVGDVDIDKLARTLDILEKWYGARLTAAETARPRPVRERLAYVQTIVQEAVERGLLPAVQDPSTGPAKTS